MSRDPGASALLTDFYQLTMLQLDRLPERLRSLECAEPGYAVEVTPALIAMAHEVDRRQVEQTEADRVRRGDSFERR